MAEFEMDTAAFGRVRIGNLKVSDVSAAESAHTEQHAQADDVARILFSRLARPLDANDDALSTNEKPVVRFDGAKLSAAEVEEFAGQLAKRNSYFAKTANDDEITRDADESSSLFLLRLILQYRTTERERWEKLMRPVTSSVFGDATRSAWAESVLASNRLGATVSALRAQEELAPRLELPSLPRYEHPMHGTNERLDTLVERLEDYRPALIDTAAAIVALERTVREMQANFASNSAEADRRMLRAEIVAIISLVFTALGFATSTYFSTKQINDDSVVKELQAIRTEQQTDRRNLANALEKLVTTEAATSHEVARLQSQNNLPHQGLPAQPRNTDSKASTRSYSLKPQN
jgi:cell division protein FtsB